MTKVTFTHANALAKLQMAELAPVLDLLRAERTDALEKMASAAEEWQWRKLQGKALFVEELLKLVDDAPALMAKLKGASR